MSIRKVQGAFMAGEISPAMYGRFDDQKYGQGLAVCRNFIPRPQGPVANRPGFEFVREVKYSDKPTRLVPFQFSATQTMVVELGDKYARFHTLGQTLLTDAGEPYEIETPYEARDVMELRYVQAGDVLTLAHNAYPPMELRRYGPLDWRIVPVSFRATLNPPTGLSGSYKVVAPKDVTITDAEKTRYDYKYKVTAVKSGRSSAGVDNDESFPSEECVVKGNLYLENATVSLNWAPVAGAERYRIYKSYKGLYGFIGETTNTSFIDDNYKADEERTPPLYDDPFSQAKGIKSVRVIKGGTGYKDRSVFVKETKPKLIYQEWRTGEDGHLRDDSVNERDHPEYPSSYSTEDVPVSDRTGGGKGAVVRLTIENGKYATSEGYSWQGNDPGTLYYFVRAFKKVSKIEIVSSGEGYNAPYIDKKNCSIRTTQENFDNAVAFGVSTPDGALLVQDKTGYGAVLEPVIEDGAIKTVNVRYPGVGYSNPSVKITLTEGSGAELALEVAEVGDYPSAVAYFEQRRVFAGTTSQPQSLWMTRSGTESDMTYTLPAKDDNRIKFRIAAQEASRIQHIVPLSQLVVLTTGTEFRVTSVNSDAITPKSISVKPQSYIGASPVQPVIVNSSMVYAAARGGHVREFGYSFQAQGFVSGDLSLRAAHLFERDRVVSMTLQKAPDPIVWCAMRKGGLLGFTYLPDQGIGGWHRHDTVNGAFEAVACVSEGEQDVLYTVVRRRINGRSVRYIERLAPDFNGRPEDAFYVDCGSTYQGEPTRIIRGLDWLEGETVAVLGDGAVLPRCVVKDGTIELSTEVSLAHVGLPIQADIKTLPVVLSITDGSYGKGHAKNINDIWAQVYQSSGFKAGVDFEHLVETKPRFEEPYGKAPDLYSGELPVVPESTWGREGAVCIRQDNPLPLTLASLTWQFM